MRSWPTVGLDTKVLKDIAERSKELSLTLKGASPRAQAEIATAALQAFGDVNHLDGLPRELAFISDALQVIIKKRATQSRNQPHTQLVRALQDVAGQKIGNPSTRPKSRFYEASVSVFKLAGLHTDPNKAIQVLMRERRDSTPGIKKQTPKVL